MFGYGSVDSNNMKTLVWPNKENAPVIFSICNEGISTTRHTEPKQHTVAINEDCKKAAIRFTRKNLVTFDWWGDRYIKQVGRLGRIDAMQLAGRHRIFQIETRDANANVSGGGFTLFNVVIDSVNDDSAAHRRALDFARITINTPDWWDETLILGIKTFGYLDKLDDAAIATATLIVA